MSVSISIVPFSESLDVYGEPDRHAAYSLSGYVEVSLSSSLYASYFDRRRIVSILLQSLVVTFEGQTELLTEETGYSALRLCSISQQLVTDEPIELSNIEHDQEDGACTWNVVFNLTVPGWLPETSKFGQREGGTRYALHASAVLNNGDSSGSSSWFSTFCSPFRSQTRIVKAPHVDIQLNRLRSPPQFLSESTSVWPHTHYAVIPDVEPKKDNSFPVDLLSSLRVQMSAPEFVGMEDESVPFSLRLRAVGLSESECNRLRVSDFDVELEQSERYRMLPLDAYIQQYPVPPRSQQPPRVPLLDPHPVQAIYELGLASPRPIAQNVTRSFSLLPENTSGHYVISGDGYAFRGDANTSRSDSWFSLQTSVGVAHRTQSSKEDDDSWKSRRTLRPSSQSPFLGVVHKLYVTLTCTYDLTEGENPERVTRRIRFFVPLRFTRTLPQSHCFSVAGDNNSPENHSTSPAMGLLDLPKPSSPYATSLPAYSQLFYANGDRKIDYSIPLPVYTPDPSTSDLVLGKYPDASEPEETDETAPLLQ